MKRSPVWTIEIRKGEKAAFVRDHTIHGKVRYLKTHRCVYYEGCPMCNVGVGEPCLGDDNTPTSTVHPMRRDVFYKRVTREVAEEQAQAARELQERHGIRVRKGGRRGA